LLYGDAEVFYRSLALWRKTSKVRTKRKKMKSPPCSMEKNVQSANKKEKNEIPPLLYGEKRPKCEQKGKK
jgi:hypothetical protein